MTSQRPRRTPYATHRSLVRSSSQLLGLAGALGFVVGCGSTVEQAPTAASRAPVETSHMGDYFEIGYPTYGALGEAQRATGTVLVPTLSGGQPVFASDGTPIRATCGVTFITPRYAVTAEHCVAASDVPNPPANPLIVQTYHLTNTLDWTKAKTLSGTFPAYTHGQFTAADGYVTKDHVCHVVKRCGDGWGPYQCDAPLADVALLRCDDAPGCANGYVDIAQSDAVGLEVEMPWAHEVYDVPNDVNDDRYWHYTNYWFGESENFHYFGGGRNQLLPLLSIPWQHGDFSFARHTVSDTAIVGNAPDPGSREVRWTDIQGCHGSSGSGVLTKNAQTGAYELLGPLSAGTFEHETLCQESVADPRGAYSMGYSALTYSQMATADIDECVDAGACSTAEVSPILLWLQCHRVRIPSLRRWPELKLPWPWPWPCLTCPPWERTRIHNEPLVRLDPGASLDIPEPRISAGSKYRVSIRVVPSRVGDTSLVVSLGGQPAARGAAFFDAGEHAGRLSAEFVAKLGGAQTLSIQSNMSTPVYVTEIVLVRDGVVLDFDSADERAAVGLVAGGRPIEPMRFTGDGQGGFAALLGATERMVVTRQALTSGRNYTLTFAASRDSDATCGFIYADGTETITRCSISKGLAKAALGATGQPLAYFIELPRAAGDTRISKVLLR